MWSSEKIYLDGWQLLHRSSRLLVSPQRAHATALKARLLDNDSVARFFILYLLHFGVVCGAVFCFVFFKYLFAKFRIFPLKQTGHNYCSEWQRKSPQIWILASVPHEGKIQNDWADLKMISFVFFSQIIFNLNVCLWFSEHLRACMKANPQLRVHLSSQRKPDRHRIRLPGTHHLRIPALQKSLCTCCASLICIKVNHRCIRLTW